MYIGKLLYKPFRYSLACHKSSCYLGGAIYILETDYSNSTGVICCVMDGLAWQGGGWGSDTGQLGAAY